MRTIVNGELLAKSSPVPMLSPQVGLLGCDCGAVVRLACTKPHTSPSPLIKGGPAVGDSSVITAVSSMPLAPTLQCVACPASAEVRSEVVQMPPPVPYMACAELKGSIATSPQLPKPACVCPGCTIHGDTLESRTAFAPTSVQVEPPLVLRYMVSLGHQ